MNLKDLDPIHQTALRTAWLDLCHAHTALGDFEPNASHMIRSAILLLLSKYPHLQAVLISRPADREEC